MTVEIDVDKIKSRKAELEAELKNISNLILLAEQFGKPAPIAPEQPPPMPSTPAPIVTLAGPHHSNPNATRGFTAGLRRAVLLALHTGPATVQELAKALAWDVRRVTQVTGSMLKFHLIFLNEHGRLQLGPGGTTQAQWYLANAGALTYRPGKDYAK